LIGVGLGVVERRRQPGVELLGMGFVGQEFFPKSDRPEVMLDLTLPRTASIKATDAARNRR
ncbi:efflux RND transporter permease subunit, partial [Mesorhizobium sp. M2D.F.Ca.ET.178.01.1.1]|uniref:efflux RND transporter permease subunit n=1 Tax=Mesorhizobium sp. M2D.F.Ca.ET.178.01.1.1 TaxID=2563937 RepID=UPI00167430C7